MAYSYKAIKVDSTTWMVKRYSPNAPDGKMEESLMCGQPVDATEEQVIQAAIERGSWA